MIKLWVSRILSDEMIKRWVSRISIILYFMPRYPGARCIHCFSKSSGGRLQSTSTRSQDSFFNLRRSDPLYLFDNPVYLHLQFPLSH